MIEIKPGITALQSKIEEHKDGRSKGGNYGQYPIVGYGQMLGINRYQYQAYGFGKNIGDRIYYSVRPNLFNIIPHMLSQIGVQDNKNIT